MVWHFTSELVGQDIFLHWNVKEPLFERVRGYPSCGILISLSLARSTANPNAASKGFKCIICQYQYQELHCTLKYTTADVIGACICGYVTELLTPGLGPRSSCRDQPVLGGTAACREVVPGLLQLCTCRRGAFSSGHNELFVTCDKNTRQWNSNSEYCSGELVNLLISQKNNLKLNRQEEVTLKLTASLLSFRIGGGFSKPVWFSHGYNSCFCLFFININLNFSNAYKKGKTSMLQATKI